MNKQELIDGGYKYIATQNHESEIEVWAKFTGYLDAIGYVYYCPETDSTLSRDTLSYVGQLDMYAKMIDKLRANFCKDITYDKESIWFDKDKNV